MENSQESSKISRRDFLKRIGIAGGAIVGGQVANIIAGRPENPVTPPQEKGFYPYVNIAYPATNWVVANWTIAAEKLNGKIIKPQETFSLISTLGLDQDLDLDNTDPQKGYVFGFVNPQLEKIPAAGVCVVATDLFRCCISSPLVIEEARTHLIQYPTLFTEKYPLGTDASVYVAPDYQVDLKIKNPWDFPVKINYQLYDVNGNRLTIEALNLLSPCDYVCSLITNGAIYARKEYNLPIPHGYIPDKIGINPVSITCSFEPIIKPDEPLDWKIDLKGPYPTNDGQYQLDRKLIINGKTIQEMCYKSDYRPDKS